MAISVFDIFRIGIGPSSSHTVGPLRAAGKFVESLKKKGCLDRVTRVKTELFGSLGATGKGHGCDRAVVLGLRGEWADRIDPDLIEGILEEVRQTKRLNLPGAGEIAFDPKKDIVMHRRRALPFHPNGIRFRAFGRDGELLEEGVYFSLGGGSVVVQDEKGSVHAPLDDTPLPYAFTTGDELLGLCRDHGMAISRLMLENEKAWRAEDEIREKLLDIWRVMQQCVIRGSQQEGVLPGGMNVRRRAAEMYRSLTDQPEKCLQDPLSIMDWVNFYALAVNEENAAGGRVVTAPTNGAAGVIPAVLHYYDRFYPGADEDGVVRFLLTAGAIGILYKENASISGAEVGCQGEVGAACSMASGALAEVTGGTPEQVENAAEIGMEHNLGLTCDPVGGLVQVPCIERNAMAAVKAINAARMALLGDGKHFVSLDKVIKTMRETGADMKTKYKETARGGLAINVIEVPVNVIEC
jgi:L-serine dehydratase